MLQVQSDLASRRTVVTHHVSGLVLQTELLLAAWEAKRGLLGAPWLLTALGNNIDLQAPQRGVAVYPALKYCWSHNAACTK